MKCKQCNSFAQWGIDNLGYDFLDKYWDWNKNNELNLNPWVLSRSSQKKVWIKCQMVDYHESYEVTCANFSNLGNRCSYCGCKKVHSLDSLGEYITNKFGSGLLTHIWSNKNKKSPFDFLPKSDVSVYWKCQNDKHKDYKRKIGDSSRRNFRCPNCEFSKGEGAIEQFLRKNLIAHKTQVTSNELPCSLTRLVGVGGRSLSYDFYLPKQNLLVEYQGEYHDGTVSNMTTEKYEYQKEHDKRKREYAEVNNIRLLEIWYWDFDNIEDILTKELNSHKMGVVLLA